MKRKNQTKIYSWEEMSNMTLSVPDCSAYEMVKQSALRHQDAPAYDYMGKKCTYKELIEKIDACASALYNSGIRKGDIVTICMPNTPESVISIYALNKIGAIANVIHPLSSEDEICRYINSADSRILIAIDICIEKIKCLYSYTKLERVIVVSPSDSMPALLKYGYKFTAKAPKIPQYGCFTLWQNFIKEGVGKKIAGTGHYSSDPAAILHSGGTTGTPKEIVLTNRNFIALGKQSEMILTDIKEGDNVLAILPLFHAFGLGVCIHVTFCNGACAVLVPRFDAKKFAKLFAKYRPTIVFGVPTLYEALLKSKGAEKLELTNLKYIVSGGDSLSPAMEKRINDFLSSHGSEAKISQGYGLTESFGAVCLALRDCYKPGSIGKPMPGNEFCIVTPGTHDMLPDNTDGEICISGPTLMAGYRNNEKETAQTLQRHPDGKIWLHTGDIGYRDEDGCYFYRLRLKRLIISSGFNVYPQHIENIIEKHQAVSKCIVIGIPHPYKVEVAKAYIVLKDDVKPSDELTADIMEYCRKHLARYSVPAEIEYRKALPQTIIGKTDFNKLKQEHIENIKKEEN